MPKSMSEVHAAGGHVTHPRPRCPKCTLDGWVRLRVVVVHLLHDTDPGRVFYGYTQGGRWKKHPCPQLPLQEFCRLLDVLITRGEASGYTVIDDREVRVMGNSGERVVRADRHETTDGDKWLFEGAGWTFDEFPGEDVP